MATRKPWAVALLCAAGLAIVLRRSWHPTGRSVLAWSLRLPRDVTPASVAELDDRLAAARSAGVPVLIDFSADWCAACRVLDRETYGAPAVVREAARFVTIRVDATHDDDAVIAALGRRFGVQGLPTLAFVASDGELLATPHVTGFVGPEDLVGELRKVR